jgi:hypothetical protein
LSRTFLSTDASWKISATANATTAAIPATGQVTTVYGCCR